MNGGILPMDIKRVLWIEDNAARQFEYMATAVFLDGRFDLVIARDASEGMEYLRQDGPFDVVIVDIRLPPGDQSNWRLLAHSHGHEEDPCLGLEVLRQVFSTESSHEKFGPPIVWADRRRFGLLTVENNWGKVQECLQDCGIEVFRLKTADHGERILLELIEEILDLADKNARWRP
jgi:CheY-like chemotaxis protein